MSIVLGRIQGRRAEAGVDGRKREPGNSGLEIGEAGQCFGTWVAPSSFTWLAAREHRDWTIPPAPFNMHINDFPAASARQPPLECHAMHFGATCLLHGYERRPRPPAHHGLPIIQCKTGELAAGGRKERSQTRLAWTWHGRDLSAQSRAPSTGVWPTPRPYLDPLGPLLGPPLDPWFAMVCSSARSARFYALGPDTSPIPFKIALLCGPSQVASLMPVNAVDDEAGP